MARNIVYVVFLLPVVASLLFGTLVMGEILKQPDRELNMWNFEFSGNHETSSDSIQIIGIEKTYSTSSPIEIEISVDDAAFDCGDLYVTIQESVTKSIVTQSGYFGQCFERDNLLLPVDDVFSETISEPGKYEIHVELSDKHSKMTLVSTEKFTVS